MSEDEATRLALEVKFGVETWMAQSITCIDGEFGDGFAEAHPELVGSFMVACALSFGTASLGRRLDAITEALNEERPPGPAGQGSVAP